MSATNVRKADGTLTERHPDDYYATPAWATEALLLHLGRTETFLPEDVILDPCCGDGAILDVVRRDPIIRCRHVAGLEIDDGRASQAVAKHANVERRDALDSAPWPSAHWIITNPPFKLAREFVERALKEANGRLVVMLLRLAFMASQKRAALHREHPSDVLVLPRRPSFTPDGKTDSADYGWFCWGGESRRGSWRVLG